VVEWCFVADLITHAAVAVIVKAGTGWRMPAVFVAGTVLPDVASRVPAISLGYIHVHLAPIPEWLLFAWEPMHQPLGMTLLAYLVSLFFRVSVRPLVFLNLLGGMALHLALDVLQSHHGAGYMLGFPFGTQAFELGWIGSEATVPLAVPLCAVAWWLARNHGRRNVSAQEE
jgi:hypothetical protein